MAQCLACVNAIYCVSTGSGLDVPHWKFGGSTVVSSNYVRLTPDRQSKKGILWNTVVKGHFVVIFEFDIHLERERERERERELFNIFNSTPSHTNSLLF